MAQPEHETLLDDFYKKIGATNVVRRQDPNNNAHASGLADLYVHGSLNDRFGAARYFNEKVLQNQWLKRYLTVTVDLPSHPYHGKRGAFWESMAHWHVTGYLNEKGDGLAAVVVCNFQVLQDFVSMNTDLMVQKDAWIETTARGRFLRVPIVALLHDLRAANSVVTYKFDKEGEDAYMHKKAILKMAYGDSSMWSPFPLNTY